MSQSDEPVNALSILTSTPGWVRSLARAYATRTTVELVDDAQLGVDPLEDTLLDMGRKAKLSRREWSAVLVALGVGAAGAYLLLAAILDPEPFSKIALALSTGAFLLAGGGFAAIRVLVGHKPPNIQLTPRGGFRIWFD